MATVTAGEVDPNKNQLVLALIKFQTKIGYYSERFKEHVHKLKVS